MAALQNHEIVAADSVINIDPASSLRSSKTRIRTGINATSDMFNPETHLSRSEVERLLQNPTDAA